MKLSLKKPIIFFDLETTGVSVTQDRIVQLSYIKVMPNGQEEEGNLYVNPEMHIPEGASNVHHIYDEDVRDCRTFAQLADDVLAYIADCDLAGYNSNHFDVPMLQEELLHAGQDYDLRSESKFIDVFVIFQKHTPRNLTAAYLHYCGKNLEDAHSADADTMATCEEFKEQMKQHADLPVSVEALADYTTQQQTADLAGRIAVDDKGRYVINFGKYKGQPVVDVFTHDSGYYSWLMSGDFPLYTKRIFRQEMEKLKTQRREQRRQEERKPATEEQLEHLRQHFDKNGQGSLF